MIIKHKLVSFFCKTRCITSSLLILLLSTYCIGQNIIKGKVVDENDIPIEFASVYIKGKPIGTNTNEQGIFTLKISSDNNLEMTSDSLIISHIKFKSTILSLENIKKSEKFILKLVTIHELDTVLVLGITAKESGILGTTQKKTDQFFRNNLYESYQIATFISNNLKKEGFINEIQIYIGSLGNRSYPFRIKLFKIDSTCTCPGELLLNENIIVKKIHKGWNKVNLSNFYLDIPKNGFFIAYEWLYDKIEKRNESIFENSHSIGIAKDKELLVTYEKIGDSKWTELKFLSAQKFKPMFRAKVIYYTDGK